MFDLPYKMIFAIGTIDSLYIYDTQSITPRFAITNIHYQAITDLAWNKSNLLAASSADGYVSFFIFDKDELGIPEDLNNIPEEIRVCYESYINVDINKNVYQQNIGIYLYIYILIYIFVFFIFLILIFLVPIVMKGKKKKDEDNKNTSQITNNNINNDNKINNTTNIENKNEKLAKMQIDELINNHKDKEIENYNNNNNICDNNVNKNEIYNGNIIVNNNSNSNLANSNLISNIAIITNEDSKKKKRITPIKID
jgi:hypothetical protein